MSKPTNLSLIASGDRVRVLQTSLTVREEDWIEFKIANQVGVVVSLCAERCRHGEVLIRLDNDGSEHCVLLSALRRVDQDAQSTAPPKRNIRR